MAIVSFSLAWKDWAASHPLLLTPFILENRGFKFFSRFFNYISLFDKLLLCIGLDGSHANFHSVEKLMLACLEKHGQRHACRAHERKIAESLYIILYRFSSFLDCQKECVYGYFGIILIESGEELVFYVEPGIEKLRGDS